MEYLDSLTNQRVLVTPLQERGINAPVMYLINNLTTGERYTIDSLEGFQRVIEESEIDRNVRLQVENLHRRGTENTRYVISTVQSRSGDEPIRYLIRETATGRSITVDSLENIEQQLDRLNNPEPEVSRRIGPIVNANYEGFGNSEQIQESSDNLHQLAQLSYETLVKRLYNLPVDMPEFLIVNGLKLNFIPFSQVSSIQIERYIIEPLLQPWAGSPSTQNRIITIFGKNGMTYLLKAKYDPVSNQIFPPI